MDQLAKKRKREKKSNTICIHKKFINTIPLCTSNKRILNKERENQALAYNFPVFVP